MRILKGGARWSISPEPGLSDCGFVRWQMPHRNIAVRALAAKTWLGGTLIHFLARSKPRRRSYRKVVVFRIRWPGTWNHRSGCVFWRSICAAAFSVAEDGGVSNG